NDYFHKLTVNNGFGRFGVQLTVEGDDATKGGFAVGGVGQIIGFADAAIVFRYHGHTAGVGVFDDHTGRFGKGFYALQRSVGVGHVVVRQFFALQLFGGGNRGFNRVGFHVKRRVLMRVLAVTHVLRFDELAVEGLRERQAVVGAQFFR